MTSHALKAARVLTFAALLALPLATTGCGPLLRQRAFNNSKEYFVSTPLESHNPQNGARASWHLISDPEAATPYLLERIGSDDITTAGVSIVLLQAIGGKQHNEVLRGALEAHDWSTAPGHLSEYVLMIQEDIENANKGVMEQ